MFLLIHRSPEQIGIRWQYSTISEVQCSLYLGRVGTRLVPADGPKICRGEREKAF